MSMQRQCSKCAALYTPVLGSCMIHCSVCEVEKNDLYGFLDHLAVLARETAILVQGMWAFLEAIQVVTEATNTAQPQSSASMPNRLEHGGTVQHLVN